MCYLLFRRLLSNTMLSQPNGKNVQKAKTNVKPKVFTEYVPTKFSPDLVSVIEYVVFNYQVNGKRVFNNRSNFIRSACIKLLREKLDEMGENDKLRKF